jgi:uroporphyrinogen decarboxylase
VSAFLDVCQGRSSGRVPVWFMRQAGRYLPEYRKIREKHSILDICRTPELAVEATLQPLRRFDFDAAILFSDLLIPLQAMGVSLEFAKGEGPVIHHPIRSAADVDRLKDVEPARDLAFALEAIRLLRKELKVPLIGFAGAPFTLASYLIEGGASRSFARTKLFMLQETKAWKKLLSKLSATVNGYLRAQSKAGVQAVQLFDSWVGSLTPEQYREYVLPHSEEALSGVPAPRIHFGTGTAGFLNDFASVDSEVVGVDWRMNIGDAFLRLPGRVLQGNLDPVLLLGPKEALKKGVRSILDAAGGRPFIFNLGHGVLPETPIENVAAALELVHESRKVA